MGCVGCGSGRSRRSKVDSAVVIGRGSRKGVITKEMKAARLAARNTSEQDSPPILNKEEPQEAQTPDEPKQ